MYIVRGKHCSPQFQSSSLHDVTCLLLVHRVHVRDSDQLLVTEALCIRDVRKIRVAFLAEFTDDQRLVELRKKIR